MEYNFTNFEMYFQNLSGGSGGAGAAGHGEVGEESWDEDDDASYAEEEDDSSEEDDEDHPPRKSTHVPLPTSSSSQVNPINTTATPPSIASTTATHPTSLEWDNSSM